MLYLTGKWAAPSMACCFESVSKSLSVAAAALVFVGNAAAQVVDRERVVGAAIDFVAEQEAFESCPYDDLRPWISLQPGDKVEGTLTVGFGSTGPHVKIGKCIDEGEARRLLETEVNRVLDVIEDELGLALPVGDWIAFVSLSYNIGVDAFRKSTALERYRAGECHEAASALLWWNKSKGRVLAGLVSRRAVEASLMCVV